MQKKMIRTADKLIYALLSSLALTVLLAGCGYKTLPVAPQEVVPKAINDLAYELSDKGVTLSWTYPSETITGDKLTNVAGFEIYRAVVPADSYCDTCPIPFGMPVTMPGGGVPQDGRRTGTYESTLLRQGHLYFFKIRARTGWWAESADSNIVSFLWDSPPATPAGLTVEEGDASVHLSWQKVSTYLDGKALAGPSKYQVYRSVGGSGFVAYGDPVDVTEFTDTTVSNGRKYLYKVQAVSVYDAGTVGGGMTDAVSVTPKDMTPPAPPTNVRAVRAQDSVKVFWEASPEKDVVTYRVYRRLPDGNPVAVGDTSAQYTLLVDKNAPAGAERIYYSVSAVDKNGNESATSPEALLRR